MAAMLETPSRVWRRIEDIEGRDMPSLPSLPAFEDSADHQSEDDDDDMEISYDAHPIHSTPAPSSHHTATTIRPTSAASTARFAQSIASRSAKSSISNSRGSASRHSFQQQLHQQSFDISSIGSVADAHEDDLEIRSSDQDAENSRSRSVPDVYLPPTDDELDISDALQSISRSNSPVPGIQPSPQKVYDYSVSLRTEPKPSPFDKLRHVSVRRPLSRTQSRTPSLSRTTPSPSSSLSNSTPHSTQSYGQPRSQVASPIPALTIPLPRSATASPTGLASPRQREGLHRDVTEDYADHGLPSLPEQDQSMVMASETDEASEDGKTQSETPDEREPTFSSEEGLTPSLRDASGSNASGHRQLQMPSPVPLATAFSSPGTSVMFTPTPAFQPRPRARFNLPPATTTTPMEEPEREEEPQDEDVGEQTWRASEQPQGVPETPYAHKRSFLLSVINSTARPRPKFLTPHPNRVEEASEAANSETPGTHLHAAFAGVTPRPRPRGRLSHPLAQGWTAQSDTGSGSESRAQSPYDGAVDRASFISTTSSQDLTTHARANASFDPVMGLGERGHGVGRFNAGKLNSYLHGLNRKLQEENEALVIRLKEMEELVAEQGQAERAGSVSPGASGGEIGEAVRQGRGRRVSGGGRRVSAGPLGLVDVQEDAAEGWVEEKAALEDMLEDLKEDLEKTSGQKAAAEEALEAEKAERVRDKERWRDRMGEVEKGVEGIVRDLEVRLHEAAHKAEEAERDKTQVVKEVERRLAEVVVERDILAERLEKAEGALQSGRGELGAELNAAHEQVSRAMGDLKNANLQITELEDEVMRADERIDALEKDLRQEKKLSSELEEELRRKSDELSDTVQRIGQLQHNLQATEGDLQNCQAYVSQLEGEAGAAIERIENLEDELAASQQKAESLADDLEQEQERTNRLKGEAERASELARQMEDALEAAEKKMLSDEDQVAAFKIKLTALERELDRSRSHIEPSQAGVDPQEFEALEAELDEAHKEIGRLNALLNQSPARKAIEKAKDAKIEALEQDKEDLLERLKSLKNQSIMMATPSRMLNGSHISPMHRQIMSLSMKSPKTPGGPLKDLSWLQNTMHDPSAAPLLAEIERLQQELDRANESIDDKLDRLEDAGLGTVSLTNQLEDAKSKILTLEDELARLSRREDRRIRRMERLRCSKCLTKVDIRGMQGSSADESSFFDASQTSFASEPATPPTKTSERLRKDLESVNSQLTSMRKQWDEERRKLMGEKAVLQDAADRLNLEIRNARSEIHRYAETERDSERAKAGIQGELDKAKRTVGDLEAALTAERSRLRALTTEQSRAERKKEEVGLQLHRTEADMSDVRQQLQKIKQQNHELEAELRANANLEQKARLLESKVAANSETIDQLRQERSLLVADHKDLQRRYAEVSDHVSKLRDEHAASQTSHDKRRHQLDLQLLEIEDLRRALSDQADELQRAEAEKDRMANEKNAVVRTIASLEADLRRVKQDAEAFGRDLKLLRAQKDRLEAERKEEHSKAERSQKQSQTQLRLLKEQLQEQSEKTRAAKDEWKNHVCAADRKQLGDLRLQHNQECKGLIVQIKYLKAKFVREEALRRALGQQKKYLLVLLGKSERLENQICAAIARIGFPVVEPPTGPTTARRKTLRCVTLSVMFVQRAKRASEVWQQQRASRNAIADALQEVRRQRAAGSSNC